MTDIPSRLRAWKSLRACDFEENNPLAEDLEAAAQAFQQQAREIAGLRNILEQFQQNAVLATDVRLEQAREIERLHDGWRQANVDIVKRDIRISELEAEIIRLAEPPNPPLTMNDALALLNAQVREIERLKTQLHDSHVSHARSLLELGNRTIRLGELEAEREAAKGGRHILAHGVNELTIEIGQLRAERDKLREMLEIPAPSPPCMMPDGGECCPQYHAAVIRIDKLRETLAGMPCSRQINAGTIAECTGRNQCYCPEGAAFIKTGTVG